MIKIQYFIDKKYFQEPDEPYESAAEADDVDEAADANEEEESASLESESIEE